MHRCIDQYPLRDLCTSPMLSVDYFRPLLLMACASLQEQATPAGGRPGRSGVCCGGAEQNRPGARNKCKSESPQKSRQTRHSRHKPAQPGTTRHGNGSGVTPSGLAPAGWYADEDCWPHRKTCFLRRDWMLGGRRLPWITNRPPALANGPAACLMPMLNGFNLSQPG